MAANNIEIKRFPVDDRGIYATRHEAEGSSVDAVVTELPLETIVNRFGEYFTKNKETKGKGVSFQYVYANTKVGETYVSSGEELGETLRRKLDEMNVPIPITFNDGEQGQFRVYVGRGIYLELHFPYKPLNVPVEKENQLLLTYSFGRNFDRSPSPDEVEFLNSLTSAK